jgi:3-oxoacyl-[acyl-carrier protein] reductase
MIDLGLAGKTVLITGANHGIGAATALAFAEQGADVFLSFYRDLRRYSDAEQRDALQTGVGGDALYCAIHQHEPTDIVARIRERGRRVGSFEADLGRPESIGAVFDACEAAIGPVDVLVNNHTHCTPETFDPAAVRTEPGGARMISASGIDQHFSVNARAYALLMAEYVRRYLGRKATIGRIINVSTDAAHAHMANVSYAASKHAIESYSRSAAWELGKYGITVNIVAPGPIQTGYLTPSDETAIAARIPLGRIGVPGDVADVIVFLASQQARWIHGQLIYVGGGWRMHQ